MDFFDYIPQYSFSDNGGGQPPNKPPYEPPKKQPEEPKPKKSKRVRASRLCDRCRLNHKICLLTDPNNPTSPCTRCQSMNVPCTYGLINANARLSRMELSTLATQSDAALERFTDIQAVIDEVIPGINSYQLVDALHLYSNAHQALLNSGIAADYIGDILINITVNVEVDRALAEGQRAVGGSGQALDDDEEELNGKQEESDVWSRDRMEE